MGVIESHERGVTRRDVERRKAMMEKSSIPEMKETNSEFSPCWSQSAFLTENDKEFS